MRRRLQSLVLAAVVGLGPAAGVVGAQGTFAGDSIRRVATASHDVTVTVTGLAIGTRVYIRRDYKSQPGLPFDSIGIDSVNVEPGLPPIVFNTPGPDGIWRYRLFVGTLGSPLRDQQFVRAGLQDGGTSIVSPTEGATGLSARFRVWGGGIGDMLVRIDGCVPGCNRLGDTTRIGVEERWEFLQTGFPTPGLQQLRIVAVDADGLADTVTRTFTTLAPEPPEAIILSPLGPLSEPVPARDSVRIVAGDSLLFRGTSNGPDDTQVGAIVAREWRGLVPGAGTDSVGFRTFATPGRFVVEFRITDNLGLVGADTVIVLVRPVPFLTVTTPAVATPIPRRSDIAGRSTPGATVLLQCQRCGAAGATQVVSPTGDWVFAGVQWASRVPDTLRLTAVTPEGDESLVVRAVTFLPNQAPTAVITVPGRDTSVIIGGSLTLVGGGTDPDGTIASGAWSLSDGRTFPTLTPGAVAFPALGPVTLSLVVTDEEGATSVAATRVVTVRPAPFLSVTTPVAGASLPARTRVAGRALPGMTVRLRCLRCTANDSTRVVGADSAFAFDPLVFTSAGADTLVLTATTAFDSLVVRVGVIARPAPFAVFTSPAASAPIRPVVSGRALPGAVVRLACARCAANDSVRTALADSSWSYGAVLWSAAGADTLRVTAVSPGPDTATAVLPLVIRPNERPVLTVTAPRADTTIVVGDSLALAATAADADGSVASVTWTLSDGRTRTGLTPGRVGFPTVGSVTVTVLAVDDLGLASLPVTRTITVLNPNVPPTIAITAPAAGTSVAVGDTVRFTAAVADPDNSLPLVVTWRFTPTDSAVGAANVPFVFRTAGAVTVSATVRDARGGTAAATVALTVTGRGVNVDRTSPGSARRVDGFDVLFVLRRLGTADSLADVNGDGTVDAADVALVRAAFGRSTP